MRFLRLFILGTLLPLQTGSSFAVQETASTAAAFIDSVGINIHLSYLGSPYGAIGTIVKPRLQQLGIRQVRDGYIDLKDSNWMGTVYGRMREIADTGIKLNLINSPAQIDTSGTLGSYANTSHVVNILQYLTPAQISSFEGLNEHDIHFPGPNWATEVRAFQQSIYTTVKGNSQLSSIPVLGPTIVQHSNIAAVGDLSASMDFSNIHPYPGGQIPTASLSNERTLYQPIGRSKPFQVTETGYTTASPTLSSGHPPVSETAMAKYVNRMVLDYFQQGIRRTFLYELIDMATSHPEDWNSNFGLLHSDGSEKPSFEALKRLMALLWDSNSAFTPGSLDVTLEGATPDIRHLLLQKRDGRFFLMLWRDVSSYDVVAHQDRVVTPQPVRVRIASNVQSARVYRPYDTAAVISQPTNPLDFTLQVPDHVLVVEWMTPTSTACDVNENGVTDVNDVQVGVNQVLSMRPCTVDLNGNGQCDVTDLQRVANAVLGQGCRTGS